MNALGSTLDRPIPVYPVTGFLGSGKTTLLNRMLRQDGPRTAVVVNEFGDVPIKRKLIPIECEFAIARIASSCLELHSV